jgi:hypothetical protein
MPDKAPGVRQVALGSYLRLNWSASLLAAPGVCSTMHGRTQDASNVGAISLATMANDGLDVFIRATNVRAATLSERTCNRGELPSHACSVLHHAGSRCHDLGTVIAGKTLLSVEMTATGRMCDCGPSFGSRCLGTVIAGKTSDNVKMAAVGRMHECGAAFGIHCLDLGTEIASKTSYNAKTAIAGRTRKRGATFGSRCHDLGTVIAGKTSLSVKMAAAGRMCDCGPTFGNRCLGYKSPT